MATNKFQERMRAKTGDSAKKAQASVEARAETGQPRALATMPAQLGAFRLEAQEYLRKIDALEAELTQAKKNGSSGLPIPLDKLHEVPGRRRYMSPEDYRDLVENLRVNDLNTPIVVDLRSDGEFEIVSGHHRTDAFRDLERTTIPGVLRQDNSKNPAVAAFYANLFQSPLTDYEKFLGFTELEKEFPGITQAQIAERSGKPESTISYLMAFRDLPQPVLDILKTTPALLGSEAARDFAKLTRAGKGEQVVEAVRQLAEGKIDQKHAVAMASTDPSQQKPTTRVEPQVIKVKDGRSTYCQMRRTAKVVRLDFQSEAEAEEVMKVVYQLLEERKNAAKLAANPSETGDSEK
jgi:ParB family transcriptional regulator, chromosome partitioning protein